jgi:subtilisin family serine protease
VKRSVTTSALLLSVVLAITGSPLLASAASATSEPEPTKAAMVSPAKSEAIGLIVRYAKGVLPVVSGAVAGASSVSVPLNVGTDLGTGWRTVSFASTMTAEAARDAADQLVASPLVLEAYPNLMHYPSADVETTANTSSTWTTTTQTSTPWGLGRIDQAALPLDYSYTYDTTGLGVKAYIVDSGIRTAHTQFTGRVAAGYHLPSLTSTTDCNGHGTHVAGTVGGTTYGVAKEVTIVPVRVFNCTGGVSTANIRLALDWVIADHQPGTPAVVNMSLGGGVDTLLDAKVQDVINDGITVVVAAGNEGQDSCDVSPARAPGAITVNASTVIDDDANYSNWGACSDLYAPGSGVTSAWYNSDSATATISGTSMASPHVAGAVARILSEEPTLTPAEVWNKVNALTSAFDPGMNDDLEANCAYWGQPPGCLGQDPEKLLFTALLSDPPPTGVTPPTPTGLVATPGPGSVGLSWSVPAESESTIIDYVIQYRWATETGYTTFDDEVSASRSSTITSLRPNYSHYVRVAAETADGVGDFSAPLQVRTQDVSLGKPTGITTVSQPTSVELSWTAPTLTEAAGTITDYVIRYKVAGTSRWVTFADGVSAATTSTVGPLSRGKAYDFSIQATIPYKVGTAATLRASTRTGLASAPTNLTASATTRSTLTLQWTEPSTGNGGEITDYVIRYRLKGKTAWTTLADRVTTETTAVIANLAAAKSYDVEVKAVTVVGSTRLSGATVVKRFTTLS